MARIALFAVVLCTTLCSDVSGQTLPMLPSPAAGYFGTGTWNADSLGNHRVLLRVDQGKGAVRAILPWRRRDLRPNEKMAWVVDAATGSRITNALWITKNREYGEVIFEPSTVPGDYYVYYLLYRAKGSRNYPRGYYLSGSERPDTSWLRACKLDGAPPSRQVLASLPIATVKQFQSIDEFNGFFPMDVIATREEVKALLRKYPDAPYLVFAEDRSHPITMTTDLPFRWAHEGETRRFSGKGDPGEFVAFQIGVFASRSDVRIGGVSLSDLRTKNGSVIHASSFTCFNTEGVDWSGHRFTRKVLVPAGKIQALWMGVQIPYDAAPGMYSGTVTVRGENTNDRSVSVRLGIGAHPIADGGDNEPTRMSRLRWLNSRRATDDSLVRPFAPVEVHGFTFSILGRTLSLSASGLPASITSSFAPQVTHLVTDRQELLASPMDLQIIGHGGAVVPWLNSSVRIVKKEPGAAAWEATSNAGECDVSVKGTVECDGFVDVQVTITPRHEMAFSDIRLAVPLKREVTRYMMGMGVKGGYRPDLFDWRWDQKHNQDALWIGDVHAGMQISFRDTNYERPLNTNFYLSKPLNMPPSWCNGGKGGVRFAPKGATLLLEAYSGNRSVPAGMPLHFYFSLLVTPFKTIMTDDQWSTRFYHKYQPLDEIAGTGANTINVHHATEINPYINYPFLRPAAMKAYIDSAHARDMRVKIYYTVRELTNRAPELFALRSLGEEVLSSGGGGGFSWLQEHLDSSYIAAWFVPELKDAAVINSGVSRWHNYYIEGLAWLVRNVGIDGLYIDDVAFDRTIMKRVRKVLDRGRPHALIDLHSANQFNPRDGFANSANLYLEHFPYLDRLWFGEYFDYNSSPDFWLVEVSGIPFGLMGEMLENGGNPWRGMIFGMTARLPWAGDPRPVWKILDEFGMRASTMHGYWTGTCPVRTDNPLVIATVYTKPDSALIALASWAPDTVMCRLAIDWKAVGLDQRTSVLRAPASTGFQQGGTFLPGDPIRIEPGKGWLLIAHRRVD